MPGYGVVPADQGEGLLPFGWAQRRLADARVYWLATVRPDGRPHVMAVWAVWLDGELGFSTGRRSRKARNLAADPRCTMAVEPAETEAVVVDGTASEVTDPERLARLAEAYRAKYGMDPTELGEPLFALRPDTVFGFDEHFERSATRWTMR